MSFIFPVPWSVPITDYWLFYLVFGIIGFALCFYRYNFIFGIAPILLWFCISDIHSFYYQDVGSNKLGPEGDYIFGVGVSMLFALGLIIWGTYLNWKKQKFRF